jgi:hypothetical protein
MTTKIQTAFSAGELDPKLYGRVDLEKYGEGVKSLLNMKLFSQGGATRRPGFGYIANAKHDDKDLRLMPFEFSITQAYVIEAGDHYFRFYKNGGQIVSGSSAVELTTPYRETDLFEIQHCQSFDTMYLFHDYYCPRKLTRTSHTSWSLSVLTQTNLPADWGNRFAISNITKANPGVVTATGHDFAEASLVYIENVPGMVEVTDGLYTATSVGSNVFTLTDTAGSTIDTSGYTSYSGSGGTVEYCDQPNCVAIFEDRLVAGRLASDPQRIFVSVTGSYQDFTTGGSSASTGLDITMGGQQANAVQWLLGTRRLLIGTQAAEWWLTGSGEDPLDGTAIPMLRDDTNHGSMLMQPIRAGKSIIFCNRQERKFYDLSYKWEDDAFSADEISILAGHLFETYQVKQFAYQQTPDSIIWVVRDDGALLGLTYQRQHGVVGWHRHTSPASGKFKTVTVIPGTSEDEVWVGIERQINGSTKVYIEQLQTDDWSNEYTHTISPEVGYEVDEPAVDGDDCYFEDDTTFKAYATGLYSLDQCQEAGATTNEAAGDADLMFDQNAGTSWDPGAINPAWGGIEFAAAKTITRFYYDWTFAGPTTMRLQGTNDTDADWTLRSWTTIWEVTNPSDGYHDVTTPGAYTSYRLTCNNAQGNTWEQLHLFSDYPAIYWGNDGSKEYTAVLRFPSVDIAQAREILTAKLTIVSAVTHGGDQDLVATVYPVLADDFEAGDMPTDAASLAALTLGTGDAISATINRTAGTSYDTADFKNAIQEIVDQSGWASGNGLCLVIKYTGTTETGYEAALAHEEGNDPIQLVVTHKALDSEDQTVTWTAMTAANFLDSSLSVEGEANITNITQAKPGVVTAAAHGRSNGDTVFIERVAGMTQVNNTYFKVASKTSDTFALASPSDSSQIDTRGYSAYISGGVVKSTWLTVSGLGHLEAETVKALVNGTVVEEHTVSSGAITLTTRAHATIVGLDYESHLETLSLEDMASGGLEQTRIKRTHALYIRAYKTSGLKVGPSDSSMTTLTGIEELALSDGGAYTGDIRSLPLTGYDTEATIKLVSDGPRPMAITALVHENEVDD